MEQEKQTYNGWTNYETWAVDLWMDNEESAHLHWYEKAERHVEESLGKHDAVGSFAEELKMDTTDALPLPGPCLYSDLLNGALSEVNWVEIAEKWVSAVVT